MPGCIPNECKPLRREGADRMNNEKLREIDRLADEAGGWDKFAVQAFEDGRKVGAAAEHDKLRAEVEDRRREVAALQNEIDLVRHLHDRARAENERLRAERDDAVKTGNAFASENERLRRLNDVLHGEGWDK